AREILSKKDLLEPRLNLSVAPALMTTEEGLPGGPGSRPLEPLRPSWRVPLRMIGPAIQVALGLSMTRVAMPNLVRLPGPEMLPRKVCIHAPTSRLPPPGPRTRWR